MLSEFGLQHRRNCLNYIFNLCMAEITDGLFALKQAYDG